MPVTAMSYCLFMEELSGKSAILPKVTDTVIEVTPDAAEKLIVLSGPSNA